MHKTDKPITTDPEKKLCPNCTTPFETEEMQVAKFPTTKISHKTRLPRGRSTLARVFHPAVLWPLSKSQVFTSPLERSVDLKHQLVCKECWRIYQQLIIKFRRQRAISIAVISLLSIILVAVLMAISPAEFNPWRDTEILTAAYIIALISLFFAYEQGGRVWVHRHGLTFDGEQDTAPPEQAGMGLIGLLVELFESGARDGSSASDRAKATKSPRRDPRLRAYSGWVLRHELILPANRRASVLRETEVPDEALSGASARRPSWRSCVSGFWGEAAIVTLAILVCYAVVWSCEEANIVLLMQKYPVPIAAVATLAAAIIIDYSARQVDRARREGKKAAYVSRLAGAYSWYSLYTWLIFAFGTVIFGILALQFIDFSKDFHGYDDQIMGLLDHARQLYRAALKPHLDAKSKIQLYATAMSYVESAFGKLSETNLTLQRQLNPVFVFAALLIFLNIIIRNTSFKRIFANDARTYTLVFTYAPLLIVFGFGAVVYFQSYAHLMHEMLERLTLIQPDLALATPESVRRYSEVVAEVHRGDNVFGFAAAIGGSGSSTAVFVWFLQWLVERSNTKEAIEEADRDIERAPRRRKARPSA